MVEAAGQGAPKIVGFECAKGARHADWQGERLLYFQLRLFYAGGGASAAANKRTLLAAILPLRSMPSS